MGSAHRLETQRVVLDALEVLFRDYGSHENLTTAQVAAVVAESLGKMAPIHRMDTTNEALG